MEPLSTLAVFAAFLAPIPTTRRPDWDDFFSKPGSYTKELEQTNHPLLARATTTEETLFPALRIGSGDLKLYLEAEIRRYGEFEAGWDGEESLAATQFSRDAAIRFLNLLPSGIPLPKPMISPDGEIGFYWDLEKGFADISFSATGNGSFFSRNSQAQEKYQDNIDIDSISPAWINENIGAMRNINSIAF